MKKKIVLVHGAWGSPRIMQSLSVGLQNITGEHVTSIELVGHGRDVFTQKMGGYGLAEYEEDILQKLPGGDVIIVGHSMGAVCGFNLAQQHWHKVKGVVMIDPPMLGGMADMRVVREFLLKPLRYIMPLLTNKLFVPTREDAKMMLYNGNESGHLDEIIRQPAAGRVIRQMLTKHLPTQSRRPCAVVIAGQSRLNHTGPKFWWARQARADSILLDDSHCGIMENALLPQIVHGLIGRVSL